ncbi:uncharacterized protein LOC112524679 isoform X2 [Cynara cardunculus var. scolymus]|uniref:uncharacterized protein LOC112524679 isoform X2 n=1 Tax=Cynara cardunculus var. scolymus TaxID=59895 RepID=UPI000D6265E7|nr:uncharacterized protein LOC112524679 isoform X2 [Cynara cardunculus var. scolymus]
MPASPAMRYSPGREPRGDNHKRGRSLENGIVFKERDDDLALFNEVQTRERDDFLLQSNDDFEDTFVTKLRHFSDHKLGMNIASRGESSDLLNTEEEKNDYEWLITPPDTPLFPSLDDEAPQIILAQRGRPRTQPMSISRSSTMEKSHRSSRGSPSPNRLSPSPRSGNTTFQPRGRASSGPSSSPPATLRPTTGSRRLSPPSSKPSSPAPRESTPTSRRLSTGSTSTMSPGARGTSPVKTSRGNSASPKVRAWQANIPGFSTEAPPNLRTSLADRPASYIRGSSPASRNGRHSKSPTASRSISSSHSHDRDRLSSRSKGSVTSSADDEVESLPSITLDGPERSNSRKVSGFRNNKALFSQKPSRPISSSSAPKRSFDLALRQMDHRRGPQNMFRPLLSSVPSSTLYAGKASPAWNSSVTTSSNASSDLDMGGAHDIEESELNQDDATSGCVKVPLPDSNVDDEVFMFEKSEDMGHETHDISPSVQLDFRGDLTLHSRQDGFESLVERDSATSVVSDDFPEVKDMLICSRCGCTYSVIRPTEEEIKLCANCRKSYSSMSISDSSMNISDTVTSGVTKGTSQAEPAISDEDHDLFKTLKPEMRLVESPEVTSKIDAHKDLVTDAEPILNVVSESSLSESRSEEQEPMQVSHPVIGQPSIDFARSKVDFIGEGISTVMKRSSSLKGPVFRSGNFSASSISYDDLSYVRGSTNSMRSSVGRGSVSASSSVDFGPAMHTDPRLHRQLSSRKSDIENHKYQRSVSSLSGTSSHAFRPSSVGTSTLDSFETSIVRGVKDVAAATAATVGSQENSGENEDVNNVRVEIASTPELPTIGQTALDSPESSNLEEPASFQKVEESGKDTDALTACTSEEDTSLDPCVESIDVAEVQLGAISEGEVGHSCSSSHTSQVSATDCDTSNHSSSIIEESMVLVKGQGGIKGRSLTLEEATDTILFCSSIVHNLAYEAASIAIEKETQPNNNGSWPLVPAVGKGYSARKEVQIRKTSSKGSSSKSQKARQKKATKAAAAEVPNNTNIGEETDLPKPRIVFPNNKENTKPPKLESKCNCRIM